MNSCIIINSEEKRNNLIAVLSGDVEKVESLLKRNNGRPLFVFEVSWGDDYYDIDCYQFSYVLYDALLFDKDDRDYSGRNIPEMLYLQQFLCGQMKHPDYGKFSFINYNDDTYFDKDDIAELKEDGVSNIDIELTNEGIRHNEEKVIELTERGKPIFLK